MNGEILILIALLLVVASLGLLLPTLGTSARIQYLVQERLRDLLNLDNEPAGDGLAHGLERWLERMGLKRINIAPLRAQLDHAGIHRPEMRVLTHGAFVLSPFVFCALAVLYIMMTGSLAGQGLSAALLGFLFGYFAPRYALRHLVKVRQDKLREEALMMIRLLQMLFESGLSIEQALRTLRDQGGILLPAMRAELDRVLKRIEAGMDRVTVFDKWAAEVGVRDVSDLAEMLLQLSRQGGNIQESLSKMVEIMEDRNRTELREKVGKLSGKMTVVMVLFLFPALLIFVAGPGVLSITSALEGLQ